MDSSDHEVQQNHSNPHQYFPVSIPKFRNLYLLTFGLYSLYWFYKNWKLQEPFIEQTIMPVWRSVFSIFFIHSLFKRIKNSLQAREINTKFASTNLATIFIVLQILSSITSNISENSDYIAVLSVVWVFAFYLSCFPLLSAQYVVNKINDDPLGLINDSYSWQNISAMIFGVLLWFAILISIATLFFSD